MRWRLYLSAVLEVLLPADLQQTLLLNAVGQRLEAELGASGGQRLDDPVHTQQQSDGAAAEAHGIVWCIGADGWTFHPDRKLQWTLKGAAEYEAGLSAESLIHGRRMRVRLTPSSFSLQQYKTRLGKRSGDALKSLMLICLSQRGWETSLYLENTSLVM